MLANQLGRLLLSMIQASLTGLYHVVGPTPMSKYGFGVELARRFGFDETQIQSRSVLESGLAAKRSPNLALSIHRLSTDLFAGIPAFSTGLDEFYEQYAQGYPQRIRGYAHAQAPLLGL
jgi:dTDP-4-dehydrorhamnose reductase